MAPRAEVGGGVFWEHVAIHAAECHVWRVTLACAIQCEDANFTLFRRECCASYELRCVVHDPAVGVRILMCLYVGVPPPAFGISCFDFKVKQFTVV